MFNKIICVTDRKICTVPFLEQIEKVCALKPQALILREKDLSEAEYKEIAKQVLAICRQHGTVFVVHTFWHAALELGISNVHLPLALLKEMTEAERKKFSCIGTSVHSMEEARQAEALGAGCLIAGHIYSSSCKPGLAPRGLSFLRVVCDAVSVPVYAIGGIGLNAAQLGEVCACGAAGACVRSALMLV